MFFQPVVDVEVMYTKESNPVMLDLNALPPWILLILDVASPPTMILVKYILLFAMKTNLESLRYSSLYYLTSI